MNWNRVNIKLPDTYRECVVHGVFNTPNGPIGVTCPGTFDPITELWIDRDGDDLNVTVIYWIDYRDLIPGPSTNKQ